jgi:signal-transduction protein with cAMP-binding, CBS, and nucleotidyltransferase domain
MDVLLRQEMKRNVVAISPKDSVKKAARVMASKNIGCVVSKEKDKPMGILTERDILKKVTAKGLDPESVMVNDIMTKDIITLDPNRTVQEAVDLLEKRKIKRLPVAEGGKILGIVTLTDLIRCMRRIEDKESKELKKMIKDLHLTKIKLQSRIISLEEKIIRKS